MSCKDKDLLAIEPIIFTSGGFASQQLASGSDGGLSGTTFTSASSDFAAAGIAEGMVLCTYTAAGGEAEAYEIISRDSSTALTASVLRADSDDDAVPPPAGSGLSFRIRTFGPQIRGVAATLSEKLRQLKEVAGIDAASFADSEQLRVATAFGALAGVFLARADNARPFDANWIKAEHYRREFLRMQQELRLAVDADGDGLAEQTRTLGNVLLRRM